MMDSQTVINFLIVMVQSSTPLIFATLGEILTEKVGNLNLGVEGMMLMGAVIGFQVGYTTSNPFIAIAAAVIAGMIGSLIYAFLTVSLRTNQVVTGLALTIFGAGFAGYVGQEYAGKRISEELINYFAKTKLPLLGDIPVIGKIFFEQDILVYFAYVCVIGLAFYINRTRFGLNLRAVGQNPAAADASGINVSLYKYIHIAMGGALAGLGGVYLSLVYIEGWKENITAGRGWIAVALVIFATWHPFRALIGALFFGGLSVLGVYLQEYELPVSTYLFDMLPYLATVIVLVLISLKKSRKNSPPASLGIPYFREDR
jgi:ABC-type uncharacterized transport system permease subunit